MKLKRPELSAKWWTTVKPDNVDGKQELEKALAKAEKALGDQSRKSDDPKAADVCVSALKGLPVTKITRECDKKNDKDVIAALKQLQKMIDAEIARCERLKKDLKSGASGDEDEEEEGKLFEKDYVHKLIKLVKSSGKELNFAFGLDMNAPEGCDLLLHRKKGSDMLWKILKKTKKFPNRLMCYGIAVSDPSDGTTLRFKLDAGSNTPPKRIYRTAKKLFQIDKKLRFKKLSVVAPNGQPLADDEPDDEVSEGRENAGRSQVTPEQKEQARQEFTRIEKELRRMAAANNINV